MTGFKIMSKFDNVIRPLISINGTMYRGSQALTRNGMVPLWNGYLFLFPLPIPNNKQNKEIQGESFFGKGLNIIWCKG